jgi:uncharacterized protein (DUF2235 family)
MQAKRFKHIIILIDGTWNSAAQGKFRDSTNIFRLNHAFDTEDDNGNPQITYYMPGPGTRGWTDKPLGGWLGTGIDEIVKEAYVNIASNYDEADETHEADRIYLFGFSRGAVAVQALSALISKCGLLYPRSIDRFWRVWNYFLSKRDATFAKDIAPYINDDVQIEMLGAFDPVLGRSYWEKGFGIKLKFDEYKLQALVKHGVQILAADDNRSRFSPLVWDGAHGATDTDRIEQIWMPGVHSDVGGLQMPNDHSGNFLSNVALLTMFERIRRHTNLSIDNEYVDYIRNDLEHIGKICISNERGSAYMKPLKTHSRRTCHERFGPETAVGEHIHPIYDIIHEQKIVVRGRKTVYQNKGIDECKSKIPRCTTEFEELYSNECARIINQMR